MITAGGDRTQTVLTAASKAEVVTVTEGTCEIVVDDDGSTSYIFDPATVAGYVKSTCATSGIPDCGSGSARFVIKPSGANSILVTAYKSASGQANTQYWSGYAASATIDYRVSTAPTASGGGGTVKVKPYTPEKTTTQKFGYYTHIPASAESQERTFLVQQSTAVQNFAFDGMEDLDIDFEQ